jgi:uncharacterized membrane protein YfcA
VVTVDQYLVLMFLVSIVAGLVGAMVGVGGGILVVPALTLLFGVPIEYAIGTSIISTIATSSGSASAYVREGITNVRIGMFLEIGSVLGSIVGVSATLFLVKGGLEGVIYVVFGVVLFFSAYNVIQRARTETSGERLVDVEPDALAVRLKLSGEYEDESLGRRIPYVATRVPQGMTVIFFAGVLSGLLGVGGGILKVLGMDTLMRLPFKVSTTTSNFMIGVTATASTGILYLGGYINVLLTAPVAIGVVIGAMGGARALMRSRPASVRILFIFVLVLFGAEMVLTGVSA